jgi:hypothetical protein
MSIDNIDATAIYYNPETDVIGVGPFYSYGDPECYYLATKELSDGSFEVIDITHTWLDKWIYLGPMS